MIYTKLAIGQGPSVWDNDLNRSILKKWQDSQRYFLFAEVTAFAKHTVQKQKKKKKPWIQTNSIYIKRPHGKESTEVLKWSN